MRTIIFTGKRPKGLPWRFNETDDRCLLLKEKLRIEIENCIKDGYTHFITGMALGVDVYAAEIVLEMKKHYTHLTLEAALPCETQASKWNAEDRERYFNILQFCDTVTYVRYKYTEDCMMQRNYYMVDKADLVIAVCDRMSGGTGATIRYANKKSVPVFIIKP